jgi:SAM-dependent methyltransferase
MNTNGADNDLQPDAHHQLIELLRETAVSGKLRTAVFSRPWRSAETYHRVDVRSVILKAEKLFQFTSSTATQQFHRNLSPTDAAAELSRLATDVYRDVRVVASEGVWEARGSKKGRWILRQQKPSGTSAQSTVSENGSSPGATQSDNVAAESHNRTRQYLIPDHTPCPFLIHMGVMTPDGHVRARHYHKFRQINRYLEFIQDLLPLIPDSNTIRIVDFGCGKSYLTFAVHYLITQICGRRCRITGLDRRQDVVTTCREIAAALKLADLDFQVGEIQSYTPSDAVDLVISLHACDTATDDALARAVAWNSRVILAVPCCQQELSAALPADSLPVLTGHGVLRDRFAALATDAIRAAVLNVAGYDAEIVEFIDMEHTAKNLLIRAIRRSAPRSREQTLVLQQQLTEFRGQLNVSPLQLERLLSAVSHGATGSVLGPAEDPLSERPLQIQS